MIDYFALLDQPRRPWLDAEEVRRKFLERSSQSHPDRVHSAAGPEQEAARSRFLELNAAYRCLRDSKERLRHLLELERGKAPAQLQEIPPASAELLAEVVRQCREADSLIAARNSQPSAVLRAQQYAEGLEHLERLRQIQGLIHVRRRALEDELKRLNLAWETAFPIGAPGRLDGLPLTRLEEIYRLSSFLNRWWAQIQERRTRLEDPGDFTACQFRGSTV